MSFFLQPGVRDGARGPVDPGPAPTEAHFMWAETSNLRGTDVPRLHEKRTSTGCPKAAPSMCERTAPLTIFFASIMLFQIL